MTTQYWITGTSGDWSTAMDWQSGVVPGSMDDAVITSSDVTVNGTAIARSLTLNASELGNSILDVSGTLTLGTLTLSTPLINGAVDGYAQLTLNGGTLSAQLITSGGGLFGQLFGYGTVSGAVIGDVDINASGGTLIVQGSLAGDIGTFNISPGATLELSSGTAQSVYFSNSSISQTLKLDAPAAFTGSINSIAVGDTIDLAGITASSVTSSGSTLTINETNGQQLTYNVSGISDVGAGYTLTVASDHNGGTLVYWAQPPESWIPYTLGDWSTAADWQSGVVPTSTDDVLITNSDVTVNGTAVAHSLALYNSTLTVSGTLTLGTLDNGYVTLSGGTLSAQSIMGGVFGAPNTCDAR